MIYLWFKHKEIVSNYSYQMSKSKMQYNCSHITVGKFENKEKWERRKKNTSTNNYYSHFYIFFLFYTKMLFIIVAL